MYQEGFMQNQINRLPVRAYPVMMSGITAKIYKPRLYTPAT